MRSVCKVAILHKILLAGAWFFVSAVEKSRFTAVFALVYTIFTPVAALDLSVAKETIFSLFKTFFTNCWLFFNRYRCKID